MKALKKTLRHGLMATFSNAMLRRLRKSPTCAGCRSSCGCRTTAACTAGPPLEAVTMPLEAAPRGCAAAASSAISLRLAALHVRDTPRQQDRVSQNPTLPWTGPGEERS